MVKKRTLENCETSAQKLKGRRLKAELEKGRKNRNADPDGKESADEIRRRHSGLPTLVRQKSDPVVFCKGTVLDNWGGKRGERANGEA